MFRLPSSPRCIGAELRRGGFSFFVASVYLPHGLDFLSGAAGDKAREEAIMLLASWAAPYSIAFIAGDFNCTLVPGLDRAVG